MSKYFLHQYYTLLCGFGIDNMEGMYMKKIILVIVTLSVLYISCNKIYYNQLYIINNCEEFVNVSITDGWNNVDTFSVKANTTFMFDEGQGIASPKGIIEGGGIMKFEVTKNGVRSKVNYLKFERWIYVEKEDKYHSELFLHINPADFEG